MDFKSENIWLHAIRLVGQVSENMQPVDSCRFFMP